MGKILFGIIAAVASIMLGKIKQIDYCFDKKKTKKKTKNKKTGKLSGGGWFK